MKSLIGMLSLLFCISSYVESTPAQTDYIVIDVRTAEEYAESHVADSVNIDIHSQEFQKRISGLDKTKSYKVYCRSGNRSGRAQKMMQSMGFSNVENIGGLNQALQKTKRACKGKVC